MSSFTSIRTSTSQLDLSAKHKLRFNSLKATSLKDIYNDETSSDGYAPANKNSNNNKQRLLLDHCDVTQSPDYRTFLLMRRPPSKIPNRFSDDSCDSDITEDELSTDEITTETTGDSQPPLVVQPSTSYISKRESDKTLAQQLDSTEQALLKVVVAEQKLTKCLRVDMDDTPWLVKQRIIQTLAKKLPDPLNYGFYCKKLGRFLLDHKPMREYLEVGGVATYELRYKRRVFQQTLRSAKESRHLLKMQGSSKRRELMGYVRGRGVDKVHALIRKGVDPNFHSATGDETPLIAASSGHKDQRTCAPVIMALVGGGAHLDFRDRRGHTPVHAAVRGGNVFALKTLLDLGASPDCYDSKDLTPLYHCCLVDDNVECLSVLIHAGCKNTCVDSQGWTVLHQVCRYGRLEQLKLLLQTCSDDQQLINKQNATGNTALHVCSLYNQEMCLVTLLKHNADSAICNYANQDPYQVAIVAGNVNLGQLIKDIEHGNNDHPLLKPTILDMLSPVEGSGIHRRHTVSVASLPNGKPQRPTLGTSFSKQSTGTRYDTHLPPNATLPTYDVTINHDDITRDRTMTSQSILRKNIGDSDDTSDILFIVCRDYEPLVPGELSLKLGDRVAVRHKEVCDGFAVGSVGGKTGRFPLSCVQAVKLRRSKLDFEHLKHEQHSLDSGLHEDDTAAMTSSEVTSQQGVSHKYRDVIIRRGVDGYGFVLRGAKSEGPIGRFIPSPRQPALQYLESVELGSNAHEAGLRSGDFVLKINNNDVSTIGHREIVERIHEAGDPLRVFVVAVGEVNDDIISMTSSTTSSNDMTSSGIPPTQNHEKISRSGSIGSAIGKLDSVLALEEGSEEDYDVIKQTATLRRRPVSRMLRSHDIQDIFIRNHPPPPRHSQSLSSATSRRLIRVLPPKLPHPASPNDDACDCDISDTSSVTSQGSTFMSDTMTSSMTSSFTVSRHSSNAAVPLTSRKPPPAPPQRRSSRLTTTSRDEEELRQLRTNIVTSSPPLSPLSPKSPGSKPTKREISIAAAVAAKALTRNHEGKPPKPTSPKGGDNQSALAMALAAKQASLHLAVDTTSGVKPSDVAKALKRNGDKQSERVSLPPPPPTPPSESGGLGGFTLPPPPDPHGHMTFDDVINLPPPPDDMMGEYPTLPPPTSFAEEKGNTPKPTKTKGDLVTSSAHDSGVDDVITRTSALKSIETISVVSSTSNISSEEGSDPGVSLTYDKGEAPITLTKVNFGSSEVATPVVCDITKKPLHEWDVAEVGRWLVGIGLGTHAGKFAENEIDGSHLPQLGKDELSELGVTRVGHRLNFERSLKKLS